MVRESFATLLKTSNVAFLLFVLLFTGGSWEVFPGFIGSVLKEITAVFRDSATQWMLVVCLAVYFSAFLILERRMNPSAKKSSIFLFTFVALCLVSYAARYESVAKSIQVPVLLAGIVSGLAVSAWVRWSEQSTAQWSVWVLRWLAGLLAGAALYQPESSASFSYRGVPRWCGVWDNPNLYGLLMGAGVVVAAGLGRSGWQMAERGWKSNVHMALCLAAVALTAYGCFKSYSRGAWLGTVCGLVYLIWNSGVGIQNAELVMWFRNNRRALLTVLLSLVVLGFWQLRFSESRVAQRVASVGNLNDFSWRNRVAAWQGATRMMRTRPVIGFGWGEAEAVYGKKYLPPKVIEGAAIQLNDFLMIGICAGVPALVCFSAYVFLGLRERKAAGSEQSPAMICRAGTVVLLVGFCLDGGLFKLPVAALFWTLLELARVSPAGEGTEQTVNAPRASNAEEVSAGKWLRALAVILALAALGISAVQLITPHLSVSERTLAIARKHLIQSSERADFDFLAANPSWPGKRLKTLLAHVELANYNRRLVNWNLDDQSYRDFVLSPLIDPAFDGDMNWRRALWENFYPRIRKENDPLSAAEIVVRLLRERVTISNQIQQPQSIAEIWRKQITDAEGFERIYVAALRSIGIPSKMSALQQAEIFTNGQWLPAPRPMRWQNRLITVERRYCTV